MKKAQLALVSLLTVFLVQTGQYSMAAQRESASPGNRLWYKVPAQNWEKEALPIGNGRLGGMVFGGVDREQIQFNEDSLWIGDERDTGSYQAFGDVFIETGHQAATDYRRELDIGRGVHTITYQSGPVKYTRQYFSSNPAGVMVLYLTADKKASYTGKISLADAHEAKIVVEGNTITSSGSLAGYVYSGGSTRGRSDAYDITLQYEAQLLVRGEGGTLEPAEDGISFKDCDSLMLLLAAGTDYLNQRDKGWKGEHPHQRISAQLAAASS